MNRRFVLRFLAVCAASAAVVSCNDITAPPSTSRAAAAPILGDQMFAELTLGDFHSCGLTAAGKAFCWGVNSQGQGGNGLTSEQGGGTPLAVLGNLTFATMSAGGSHTCAIATSGTSYCWGNNVVGQLGIGTTVGKVEPTAVVGDHAFTSISASTVGHTCALTAAGVAWCWGSNGGDAPGRLGDGTTITRSSPVQVSGGLVFKSVSAGGSHTCGLTLDGTAYCWGLNSRGQLGDGSLIDRLVPTTVATGIKFRTIAAGLAHTCALTEQNIAYCWGDNVAGALGDGSVVEYRSTPDLVAGANEFSTIAVGERHGCGITIEGITLCWGFNNYGALGDGSFITRRTPVQMQTPVSFTKIAAGAYHTCGISTSGLTYCWGNNEGLQLGSQS